MKGHYRKRPGGGRTWVAPHTRTSRGKQILAGGAVVFAALVGWAVFAKNDAPAPADTPLVPPTSSTPSG